MTDFIAADQCVDRGVYRIRSRNLAIGVYREATGGFIGIREKFGSEFLFEEYHWERDPHVGTVRPTEFIEMLPDDIEVREYVDDPDKLCREHGRATEWRPNDPEKGNTPGWRYHVDDGSRLESADFPGSHMYQPLFDYLKPLDDAEWQRRQAEYQ